MKNLKILILLPYYERPNMVRNALNGILNNNKTYENWELAFIDDGSIKKGRPVVEEILKDHLDKVKFYDTNSSIDDKINTKSIHSYTFSNNIKNMGGSIHGKYMNDAIKESDADICIFLSDDDFLLNNYFNNLNNYFNSDLNRLYCCSNWIKFCPPNDPNVYKMTENHRKRSALWSLAWRTQCNKEGNIWFCYPITAHMQIYFYEDLFNKYGTPEEKNYFADFFSTCHIYHEKNLTYTMNWKNKDFTRDDYNTSEVDIDMNYILNKLYIEYKL